MPLQNNFHSVKLLFLGMLILFCLPELLFSQWINDSYSNKQLVTNSKNPINISAVPDKLGGGFIFWQDEIPPAKSNVLFQYFNDDGKFTFRTDGKSVSRSSSVKKDPAAIEFINKTALVIWKDVYQNSQDYFIQRVNSKGELLWSEFGERISNFVGDEFDADVSADKNGNVFVSYLIKENEPPFNYNLYLQKYNSYGKPQFKINGNLITQSQAIKSRSSVAPDNKGGTYIFWLELISGKNSIQFTHIDSTGNITIPPKIISDPLANIFSYSVYTLKNSSVYVVWENRKSGKNIYHQIISSDGNLLLKQGGVQIANQKGEQVNPHGFSTDSTITISWINEEKKERDIFAQKFDFNGKQIWKNPVSICNVKGAQGSQKIIDDRSGGAVSMWIDKRSTSPKGNIFAQRISSAGKKIWDSTGVEISSNPNSEKSYLSVLPNKINGAAAIFKMNFNNQNAIYGQRILGSGRFIFEVLNLSAMEENNSVKINWETFNETNNAGFYVERASADSNWIQLKFIKAQNKTGLNSYEFIDAPELNGSYSYRIAQVDNENNIQRSSVVKVDFIGEGNGNFATIQNFPNPFSDSTTIKYFIPQRSKVEIEIYNARIESIAKIVDQTQDKGTHSITFYSQINGEKLQSGIYFYRIKTDYFVEVKKMILVR